jgi:hypothetical protein
VRTLKESQQLKGTHFLLSTEGETSEDTERKPATEGHSHTVEQRERQVRTLKEG